MVVQRAKLILELKNSTVENISNILPIAMRKIKSVYNIDNAQENSVEVHGMLFLMAVVNANLFFDKDQAFKEFVAFMSCL